MPPPVLFLQFQSVFNEKRDCCNYIKNQAMRIGNINWEAHVLPGGEVVSRWAPNSEVGGSNPFLGIF